MLLRSCCRGRRHIVSRIHVKKSIRLEQKPYIGGRHHWIVFRARNMRVSEGVPENDVCIFNRTVRVRPTNQAIAPAALVWKITGGVSFALFIRRNPYMVVDESCATTPPSVS